jgi:hypothetical protein
VEFVANSFQKLFCSRADVMTEEAQEESKHLSWETQRGTFTNFDMKDLPAALPVPHYM